MRLRLALAADHGGFALKNELIKHLSEQYDVIEKLAIELASAFLRASFSGEARHYRRPEKVLEIER